MPCLKIKTNHRVSSQNDFMSKAAQAVCSILKKPERVMMVTLEDEVGILFAGNRKPAVYMELKGIGLDDALTEKLSAELCALVGDNLNISGDRVYIVFENVRGKMWGVNGTTF
ncbi:MAG: phenylpyruvate tautomerase MIF-related protein [Thermodesulfobacteriota bacterium]